MAGQTNCESCANYVYDEESDCYCCEVDLDEDEMYRFLSDTFYQCPYYQLDDEYDGFEWVQLMKYEENVIAFMRKTEKPEETVLAVCNFAAIPYENYNVGVPFAGKYKEIFNSDDKKYGGNGVVNTRVKAAKKAECDEREYSITLKLPALGVAVFTCTPEEIEKKPAAEHSQIKKSITKTRTVRKAAGKTKAAVKTAVKPVTKKVTKEAPQIVNKTEEKIPVKKDLTEKK